MADAALLKKLLVKSGMRVLVLNAPDGYLARLEPPPDGASLSTQAEGVFDLVQLFVAQKAQLDTVWQTVQSAVKPGGVVWLAYPKLSSKVKSDMTRDRGWETVRAAGWEPVTQIAIDDIWSALRFRPVSEIPSLTRKFDRQ
ncbi:MAG: hypothetical protein KIT87_15760 [Anaerolineae bacterium]|nr:hypothetical protein [Anaerolineae bacterium]